MPEPMPMKDFCENKARQGDGAFAIAYALLDLSDSQEATASALHRLGLGNASTPMGAVELLSSEVKGAAQTVADALDGAGSVIASAIETADFGAKGSE